jgi:hypothetical protein
MLSNPFFVEKVLPVVVSCLAIVAIAIVNEFSQTFAAITTTMPTKIPLAIWIIYAAEAGNSLRVANFSAGLLVGISATIMFIIGTWFAARAGWSLVPIIGAGYASWGTMLLVILLIRRML